ncbi:MAG: hypothetical protein IPM29_18810 [Planctomycetes bacterium]|nr:hypothetical protein [Planctomycetota bacterium]
MFDRFVRMAQARRALRERRYEEALRVAQDPLVRADRRGEEIRDAALRGLLDRARRRLQDGVLAAALADLAVVEGASPELSGLAALRREVEAHMTAHQERRAVARELLDEARARVAAGDLAAAETGAGTAERLGAAAHEVEAVRGQLAVRRGRAAELLRAAERALRAGELDAAAESVASARALDAGLGESASAVAGRVAAALARPVAEALQRTAANRGDAAAEQEFERQRLALPELEQQPAIAAALRAIRKDASAALQAALAQGDIEAALRQLDAVPRRGPGASTLEPLVAALEELRRAVELEHAGRLADAAAICSAVGERLDLAALRVRASALRDDHEHATERLQVAGALAAEGQLGAARGALLEVLERHAGHADALRELARIEACVEEREQRLGEARRLAREGRVDAAISAALPLAVPGPDGEEARIMLRDLRRRSDVVGRGVAQVLRQLHGRTSATRDGLAACAGRLAALRDEHRDHPELLRLQDAVAAELQGLDLLDAAGEALRAGRLDEWQERMRAVGELRDRLLNPERLAARVEALHDEAMTLAETALRAGRLANAARLVVGREAVAAAPSAATRVRVEDLRERLRAREREADAAVADARAALADRDLAGAEQHLDRARAVAADTPQVQRLESDLAGLRGAALRVERARELSHGDDPAAAAAELGRLGPTPALMRTRIYDLRRDLAAAQGLGARFLLRVDDGGEFLVVRSDSWTIGNLRDGTADVTLLASLAGVHARFSRSMSFHGGQRDRIVAERGAVSCDGRQVDELELSDGRRVALGGPVGIEYRRPNPRSLTAVLRITGGFRVAGTERILWMKDRGRDGRILLGAGRDQHVPVESATGSVEIFADRDGRIRVRCDGEGSIDGRPFDKEHPVVAGTTITAAGVTFVVLPWNP